MKNLASAILLLLCCILSACTRPQAVATSQDEIELRAAIDRYFHVWSRQDMMSYQACFDPNAQIFYSERGNPLISQKVDPFVAGQRHAHASAQIPMTEKPLHVKIHMDDHGAIAHVHWELQQGSRIQRGVDLFTYRKIDNAWKIVSLLFYTDPE